MDLEARDLLTVEQAANYLQVSQSSIRSYIRQGRLQAFRIAGKRKVLIPRSALLALLEPARPDDVDTTEPDYDKHTDLADLPESNDSNQDGNTNGKHA
jgi:excisionase family DNA binding protein